MVQQGLQLDVLTTGYGSRTVIDKLSINALPKGKITALLGPNGCGKSTLLRAIAGLNKMQGVLLLNGINLTALPFNERAKKVVYLPQTLPAGIHLRVLESIIVAQHVSGDTKSDTTKIMQLLQQLGIDFLSMQYLDQLSGGQKQLVGLAQSLIRHPTLLLLDEPLSALDLNYQFHVMERIREETQKRDIVTIIVVHDINIALHHADHIIMLKKGRLISEGTPETVITPTNLADVYGVNARVERCSKGKPQVLIDGLCDSFIC